MSVFVQILIGVASTVIAAAVLFLCRAMWLALRRLEALVEKVDRLERHDRAVRRRLRSIQGGVA